MKGLTTDELSKKMTGLRTYYGKELGKARATKTSGAGTKDVYTSRWSFFNSLHFLRDNITSRKTSSTMDLTADSPVYTEVIKDQEERQASHEGSIPTESQVECIFNTSNSHSTKSKRKASRKLEDDLLSTCLLELKKPKPETTSSDSDTLFGQYIVSQLKKSRKGTQKKCSSYRCRKPS